MPAEEHVLNHDITVILFFYVDGKATKVGNTTRCGCPNNAKAISKNQIYNCFLAHDNGRDLIGIQGAGVLKEIKSYSCPHTPHTADEEPFNLAYVYYAGVYE